MTQERIGLFGGTFDPVHLGHLILAYDALEIFNLDHLIFLPARLSPYKINMPPCASTKDRLAMLTLALKDEPRFRIDSRELSREGPSYTIQTVREMEKEFLGATFVYLLGQDHADTLKGWRESEELKKKVTFAFFKRGTGSPSNSFLTRRIDISSTEIRERIARGVVVSHLLPTPVFTYLEKKSLYQR